MFDKTKWYFSLVMTNAIIKYQAIISTLSPGSPCQNCWKLSPGSTLWKLTVIFCRTAVEFRIFCLFRCRNPCPRRCSGNSQIGSAPFLPWAGSSAQLRYWGIWFWMQLGFRWSPSCGLPVISWEQLFSRWYFPAVPFLYFILTSSSLP